MTTKTVSDSIADLTAPPPDVSERLAVLRELPADLCAPILSNVHKDEGRVNAWLTFRGPAYDPDGKYKPVEIAQALERGGFAIMPATLVRWDNYQPQPFPGLVEDVPATKGRYKFSDSWVIAPFWVHQSNSAPEIKFFMRSPAGRVLKVSIDLSRRQLLAARRAECRGGWRYENPRVVLPPAWESLQTDGEEWAARHERCWASTGHVLGDWLEGRIYWALTRHDQAEFIKPASEIIAALEAR